MSLLCRTTFYFKVSKRSRNRARWSDSKSSTGDKSFFSCFSKFSLTKFCNSDKIFFLSLPLANVNLSFSQKVCGDLIHPFEMLEHSYNEFFPC